MGQRPMQGGACQAAKVDEKCMMAFFERMESARSSDKWMLDDGSGAGSSRDKPAAVCADGPATPEDMQLLQESFDAVSRATLAIKHMGKDLVQARATQSSVDIGRRGMELCKASAL